MEELVLEEVKLVNDVIQGLLKAKKTLRMYPSNNPIYIKTANEVYSRFENFFNVKNDLSLKIRQNEITYNNEQVYSNLEKEENLALFFFKDGIRELTFHKGLSYGEFEDFTKILTMDFEKDTLDDDIVTLLWERDYEHIKYIADEEFLTDEEDYQRKALTDIREKGATEDNIARAYQDALKAEAKKPKSVVPLGEPDLRVLAKEMEQEGYEKIDKIIAILFEILYQTKDLTAFTEVVNFLGEAMSYCIKKGDFNKAAVILETVKNITNNKEFENEKIQALQKIYTAANSNILIEEIGTILDSEAIIEKNDFLAFIKHLDKFAIPPFMRLLGDLWSIKGRRLTIEALVALGRLDLEAIAKGLQDSRWYMVRNTIYILGKIGDKGSIDYLSKSLSHTDQRVKKEAIKALGNLGGPHILPHLRNTLNDIDPTIRTAAARAFAGIKMETSKRVILDELSKAEFIKRDFSEKKEFYEVLSHWPDEEVKDFLLNTLKKKKFFGRAKNDETRACAAYAIGIIGIKEALPILEKAANSKNRLLSDLSMEAIKKIG